MQTIVVVLDGGLIQCVVAKEAMPDTQIMVVDYDTYYAQIEELTPVVYKDTGEIKHAYVSTQPVYQATIDIDATLANLENDIHPTQEEFDNE